jgi:hypothetical protein
MEELDACIAALTAYRFATAQACWVGAPEEGVIVLPVWQLEAHHGSDRATEPRRRDLLSPSA